jgi:hypothetical protein
MRTFTIYPDDIQPARILDLVPYTTWSTFAKYFAEKKEHYPMLSHLSWQLERGETVVDVGTFLGFSALALSHNQTAHVITYDLESKIPRTSEQLTPLHRHTIDFRIGDVLADLPSLLHAPFMFLDTNHDGTFEKQFVQELQRLDYKGIVLCDDIALNDQMKEFWDGITLPKLDLTSVGHWSGTGAIMFDSTTTMITLQPRH